MTVPGHVYARARNVWDIFYNWQERSLSADCAVRARQLRISTQPQVVWEDTAARAAIILPQEADPRIEYLVPNDPEYTLNFCEFHQLNATDPKQAIGLLQWLFSNQRKPADEIITLIDDLHAGLWLIDPNWIATRLALCKGATLDAPILLESTYRDLLRDLRAGLDHAKRASDLDGWWYRMHCLTPRLNLARRHAIAVGEDEGKKYHRFFDEVITDFSSYESMVVTGWLQGNERALTSSLFFNPYGRAKPRDIYDEKSLRFNLPFFWYDEALAAEEVILRVQSAVLEERQPLEQALRGCTNSLPESLDAFSPHLLTALMILDEGKLKF